MSERNDFEETNRVLELLRAQLEETDNGQPQAPQDAPADEPEEAHAPAELTEQPTAEPETTPVEPETAEETPVEEAPEEERPAEETVGEMPEEETQGKKRRDRKKRSKRLTAARRAALMAQTDEETPKADTRLEERRAAMAADLAEDSDWKPHEPEAEAPVPTEETSAPTQETPVSTGEASAPQAAPTATAQPPTGETTRKEPRKKPVYVDEQSANVMVEGLLTDIFGRDSEKSKQWFRHEEPPKPEPEKKKAPPAETKPEQAPKTRRPAEKPAARDPAQLRLELDGMTIRLPEEEEIRATQPPRQKEPAPKAETGGLFASVSVERPSRDNAPQRQAPARTSAEQMAFKRSVESSEEDFKLLLDMDYEAELGESIGFEKIKEYREKEVNGTGNETVRRGRDKRDSEYISHGQDIAFSKFYAKPRHRRLIRLIAAALILFLFIIYESPAFAAVWMRGAGGRYPLSYLAAGLVLLIIDIVLLRRKLITGFVQMFRLSPSDHSFCSVVVLVTLLYHAALFFIHPEGTTNVFFSPAAGHLLLLALANLLDSYRETAAFRVVSSRRPKFALVQDASVGGRQSDARERLMTDAAEETRWYIRPVGFVRNYFANTARQTAHNSAFGAQLILTVSAALALGLYTFASGGTVRDMGHAMFVTFLLAVPGVAVLITSLPLFFASVFRLGKKAAVIGERPVFEADGRHVLILPDNEVFVRLQHGQFELVKNCDVSKTLILIRALLDKIDSPMADSVNVEKSSRLPTDAVTLTDIGADGISAVIAGERKTVMTMGSPDYLKERCGIQVALKEDMEQEDLRRRLLCVAIGNHITALFVTKYSLEPETEPLLATLAAEDVRLMVRSKDPVVTDELMRRLCPDDTMTVRVDKPTAKEIDIRTDRADVTVVALDSGREAARTFAVCRRVRRAGRFGKFLQSVSMAMGIALGALFAFFGRATYMPAYAVTVYLIGWGLIEGLAAFLYLRRRDHD